MTDPTGRYLFAGHAIGAAARFHRLDDLHNLNHVIPTLGTSVIPATGGRSQCHVDPFRFTVDEPRKRTLLALDRVDTWVEGRDPAGAHETELNAEVENLDVVEKLHLDFLRLHMLTVRKPGAEPVVTSRGNVMEGLRLGNVKVRLELDDEPLCATGTAEQLEGFFRKLSAEYLARHHWRFGADRGAAELPRFDEHYRFSLVREIELDGPEEEKQSMSVDGYTIYWKGFGRIILGEVHVKGHERRVTMLRLAMGSDAGGTGSAGDGQSNGQTGTG